MAHYEPVNGIYRKVTKHYEPLDGAYRNVTKAYYPVDGVYREYFGGGGGVGSLAVGDSVWIYRNEGPIPTLTEFIVVHQGNPDSAIYDASCNGTWLLAKDIWDVECPWDMDDYDEYGEVEEYYTNEYESSYIRNVLENTYKYHMAAKVKPFIKQVKIPYVSGLNTKQKVNTGTNGLSASIFLLSASEVGCVPGYYGMSNVGVCLDYFAGATSKTRVAYYDGEEYDWWLRSPRPQSSTHAEGVQRTGSLGGGDCDGWKGVRPAFILDRNTPIDNSTGINIIVTEE